LLSDALNFVVSINLKFKNEIDFATFDNLMEEDTNVVFELSCLVSNMKKEIVGFWILLFRSLKNMKKKSHNIFSLMLDPRFKTFCLVSSLIVHEQGKAIVEKYDDKPLFPMFIKCHSHLHPLAKSERGIIDKGVEEDRSFDIFEMTNNTSEPTMKLIIREILIFMRYQVDVKDIKFPL
jgi:hypothetical protein